MNIENWRDDKEYSEMDIVIVMGKSFMLIDPDRKGSEMNHSPIKTNRIPLRREMFENKINKRDNLDVMQDILSEFPNNEEDKRRSWRKL